MKKLNLETIAELLNQARHILILHHIHPDADTIGSGMALKMMLEAMGKKVTCRCGEEVNEHLSFLLSGQSSLLGEIPEDADTIVSVDVASENQLGNLGFLSAKVSFMIDHHETGTPYADAYVDGSAAATAEIIYDLSKILEEKYGMKKTPEICRRLYAALADDTGNFKYSNVKEKTFRIAGSLSTIINQDEKGMHTADISRVLFDSRPFSQLRADALTTNRVRFYENGKLTVAVVTLEDMKQANLDESDFSDSVNVVRGITDVEVGILLKQQKADATKYRVSSRSNGDADVASVCHRFGGGGHSKAAGCTLTASSTEEAYALAASLFKETLVNLHA